MSRKLGIIRIFDGVLVEVDDDLVRNAVMEAQPGSIFTDVRTFLVRTTERGFLGEVAEDFVVKVLVASVFV